jgi:DNA modification methylase
MKRPYYTDHGITLYHEDCLTIMRALDPNSIDAIVTDPPYGIRFMGKAWDGADIEAMYKDRKRYSTDPSKRAGIRGGHRSRAAQAGKYDRSLSANQAFQAWSHDWALEALRVSRPGAHMLVFGGTRTYHRLTCAIEDAGWEIRDCLMWLFGGGFPKSHNLTGDWAGWGTALKPAYEPILLARKPLEGTVAQNVSRWGVGAMHIDQCRIEAEPWTRDAPMHDVRGGWLHQGTVKTMVTDKLQAGHALGRWPANLLHDGSDEVLAAFPNAPGQIADAKIDPMGLETQHIYGAMKRGHEASAQSNNQGEVGFKMKPGARRLDAGSAARFFYAPKASAKDRGHEEWDHLPLFGDPAGSFKNHHPTVKPLALMRYLIRLVTKEGQTVLDPFAGSGTTLLASRELERKAIGVELQEDYCAVIRKRLT